jgi:signal transduction histidine kinase
VKLVLKLTAALLLVFVCVLALHEGLQVRRDIATFESDMDRDHEAIGRALAAAAGAVHRTDGLDDAHAMIAAASGPNVGVRWVCAAVDDALGCGELRRTGNDVARLLVRAGDDGPPRRITYVRVPGAPGALEISESATLERLYIRTTIVNTLKTSAVTVVLCTLLAFVFGVVLVARPTRRLVEKARAIGRGEPGAPLVPVADDEIGELTREINTMVDRLDRARAREQEATAARIAAVEQLRHADRLRTVGTLASGIAHELGTPLNVIEARATMIVDDPETASRTGESAQVIVACTERIARIVRQLLMFAREREIEREPVDLAALAIGAVDLLRPLANRRGIELVVSGGRLPIEADAILLQQAITNLVMNAIQASPAEGRIDVTIGRDRRTLRGEDVDVARVDVVDRGGGVPKGDLERLFEPFFTTKEPGEGTGLGLSVTYGIVDDHGGAIEVTETPSGGATFSLILPVEPARSPR